MSNRGTGHKNRHRTRLGSTPHSLSTMGLVSFVSSTYPSVVLRDGCRTLVVFRGLPLSVDHKLPRITVKCIRTLTLNPSK